VVDGRTEREREGERERERGREAVGVVGLGTKGRQESQSTESDTLPPIFIHPFNH
jgi:hypothetical protein